MDLRAFLYRAGDFIRPDDLWGVGARRTWIAVCIACAIAVALAVASSANAARVGREIDSNAAFGFARIDPLIVYQEVRGRYFYCGYDWDRKCQIRHPEAPSPPAVDAWLGAHTAGISAEAAPVQTDIFLMETQGGQSLVEDDPRVANMEYVLGSLDVASHVGSSLLAGGIGTLVAAVLAIVLGFATFGGTRMRVVNPLWFPLVVVASAVYAWAGVHALAVPALMTAIVAVEVAAVIVAPIAAAAFLRRAIARRETVRAYWSARHHRPPGGVGFPAARA